MSEKDILRIAVAKEYVELHKAPVCDWLPFFDDSNKQYLRIYWNLIGEVYGSINDHQTEISDFYSRSGHPEIYNLDGVAISDFEG